MSQTHRVVAILAANVALVRRVPWLLCRSGDDEVTE
jgi:hypothetical protein